MKPNLFKKAICLFLSMLTLFTLFSSQLALAVSTTEHDHSDGSSCSNHEHEDNDFVIKENHLLKVPGDSANLSFGEAVELSQNSNNLILKQIYHEHECIYLGDSYFCGICGNVKEHTCKYNPSSTGTCSFCGEHMCRWEYMAYNDTMYCYGCDTTRPRETSEHVCTYTVLDSQNHNVICDSCEQYKEELHSFITLHSNKWENENGNQNNEGYLQVCTSCNFARYIYYLYNGDNAKKVVTIYSLNGNTYTATNYPDNITIETVELGNNKVEERYYVDDILIRTLEGDMNQNRSEWNVIASSRESIDRYIGEAMALGGDSEPIYTSTEDWNDTAGTFNKVEVYLYPKNCEYYGIGVNEEAKDIKAQLKIITGFMSDGGLGAFESAEEYFNYAPVSFVKLAKWIKTGYTDIDSLVEVMSGDMLDFAVQSAQGDYRSYEFLHTNAIMTLTYDLKAYIVTDNSKQELFTLTDNETNIFVYDNYGQIFDYLPFSLFGIDTSNVLNRLKFCPEGFVAFSPEERDQDNNIFSEDYYLRLINEYLVDFKEYELINDSIYCPMCLTNITVPVVTVAGNEHYWKCSNSNCDFKSVIFDHDSVEKINQSQHKITCRCKSVTEGHVFDSSIEQIDGNDAVHMRNCVLCGKVEVDHKFELISNDSVHYEKCNDCDYTKSYDYHIWKEDCTYDLNARYGNCKVCGCDLIEYHSTDKQRIDGEYHKLICTKPGCDWEYTGKHNWKKISDTVYQCTGCDAYCNHNYAYSHPGSGIYSTEHTKYCTYCPYSVKESHDDYIKTPTQHYINCKKCGYSTTPVNHSPKSGAKGTYNNPEQHMIECNCGISFLDNHDWETKDGKRICKDCGHTCAHGNFTFGVSTDDQHTKICGYCHISITENHSWSVAGTGKCTICQNDCNHNKYQFTYINSGDTKHTKACSNCGRKFETLDHDWNSLTGKCTAPSCNKECSHSVYKYVSLNKTQHKKMCTTCYFRISTTSHDWDLFGKCKMTGCEYSCAHGSYTYINSGDSKHTEKCTICGKTGKELDHIWNSNGVCTSPGCGKKCNHGQYTYSYSLNGTYHVKTCSICKKYSVNETHTFTKKDDLYHTITCHCGHPRTDIKHTSDGSSTKINNNKSYHNTKCTVCKKTYKIGHTWSYSKVTSNEHTQKCVCKFTLTTDHKYTKPYVSNGSATHSTQCACGQKNPKTVAHNLVYSDKTSSTHDVKCTECNFNRNNVKHTMDYTANSSKHTYKCTACGWKNASKSGSHSYGSWNYKNSTLDYRRCVICKDAKSDQTKNHSWKNSWDKIDSTYCGRKCSSCGEYDKKAHSFSSWGYRNTSAHGRTCSRCKYSPTASHTMSYVSIGNSKHQYKCSGCSWVSSTGSCSWGSSSNYNSSYHKRICTKCGGTKNEKHIYQYGKCSFCGRKS